jgi:regulator of replication initiation timing
MASTSEVGHAKNIANLEDLISFCTGYGTAYNPSKTALLAVTTNNTTYNNAINTRVSVFEGIRKLSTRLVNALAATDAIKQTIDDAKGFNKKIQGTGGKLTKADAGKISNPEETASTETSESKSISNSQQSYDNIVEHFSKLIDVLNTEPSYSPNETELQIATLNTLLTNLKTSNTAVINAYTNASNARITRNKTLYADKTGLCDIAQDVKNYIKSLFGATSAEYKQVSALAFKKTVK